VTKLGLDYDVTVEPVRTTPGDIDFEIPGFGPPEAVMFYMSRARTDEVDSNNAEECIGFLIPGGTQMSAATFSRDNRVTSDTRSAISSAHSFFTLRVASNAVLGTAVFKELLADGVRIEVLTGFGVASKVFAVFFKGNGDARFAVGSSTSAPTEGNTRHKTTLGIDPNVLIAASTGPPAPSSPPSVIAEATLSLGFAINDGGSAPFPQGSQNIWREDGVAVQDLAAAFPSDKYIMRHVHLGGIGLGEGKGAVEITDWIPGGYSHTTRELDEGNSLIVLAIETGAARVHYERKNSPTVAGTQVVNGSGGLPFEPGLLLSIFGTSRGTIELIKNVNDGADGIGMGAAVNNGNERAAADAVDDGANPTNTRAFTAAALVYQGDGVGGAYNHATVDTWGLAGVTLDWLTLMTANARHVWYLFFENMPHVLQVDEPVEVTDAAIVATTRQVQDTSRGVIARAGLAAGVVSPSSAGGLSRGVVARAGLAAGVVAEGSAGLARGVVARAGLAAGRVAASGSGGLSAGVVARAGLAAGVVAAPGPQGLVEGVVARGGLVVGLVARPGLDRGAVAQAGLARGVVARPGRR
jgi:hypothetical protein